MKMWNSRASFRAQVLFVAIFVGTTSLQAQFAEDALRFSQFNLPVGARAHGMGNTTVGLADDYSALFTNPAGLSSLRSYEFSIGLSSTSYKNDVAFYGINTKSDEQATNLNNLGLVYPIPTKRGALTFAFGYGRIANYTSSAEFSGFNPFSSVVEALTPGDNIYSMPSADRENFLDNNIPYQLYLADLDTVSGRLYPLVTDSVQQSATIREGGGISNWSLGAAVDIAKDLSLGVSVNLLSGSYTYDRVYTETDARGVYAQYGPPYDFRQFRFESTINSDISGYNVLIGLMYHKQGKFKLGVTVRTPTYYEISEDFSDAGYSSFYNGDHFDIRLPGETKYNISTPLVLSGGASVQISDWLVLAGDAEYTDWTEMEFTNDNIDLEDENRVIRDIFQATTNLRGGAEVTLWDMDLKLRGGIVYNPSPYKGDPKEFNQLYYTFGLGYNLDESVTINSSFAIGKWDTFRDNYSIAGLPRASRTSESVNTSTFNVTLSYRF